MRILFLLIPLFLFSCSEESTEKKNDTLIISRHTGDSFPQTVKIREDSFAGRPVSFYLNSKEIPQFPKDMYLGKISLRDYDNNFNLPDSLFSKNNTSRPFYFLAVTRSMEKSDGAYSELLSADCRKFIETRTNEFLVYFSRERLLNKNDLLNWAFYSISEVEMENENREKPALDQTIKIMQDNSAGCTSEEKKTLDKFISLMKDELKKITAR